MYQGRMISCSTQPISSGSVVDPAPRILLRKSYPIDGVFVDVAKTKDQWPFSRFPATWMSFVCSSRKVHPIGATSSTSVKQFAVQEAWRRGGNGCGI
jgi:hypothetical protein